MNPGALEGLKVVDFSWAIAGPLISKYLADFGATVVKVETATKPDIERTSPPYRDNIPGINRSAYFANWNTSKFSMSLNLVHPEGRKIARRLIQWADVVAENFTPGVMKKLGLDYEQVARLNPKAIMFSTSSYGQTGPLADVPGYGFHVSSLAGFVHFTGWPDADHPQRIGAYCDVVTPYFGVPAIMAALAYRHRTGKGQYITLSQYEGNVQFLISPLLDYQLNGDPGGRKGNRSPCASPHGIYPCKGSDRWCAIAVLTEVDWMSFRKAIGNPDWSNKSRFLSLADRKQNEDDLDRFVGEWTVRLEAEEVFRLLQESGVPCGVVQNAADLLNDPQLKHRDLLWEQDHKEIGKFHSLGQPAILSRTPARQYMPAPLLGEHTQMICHDILHISDEEFIRLLNDGVFD